MILKSEQLLNVFNVREYMLRQSKILIPPWVISTYKLEWRNILAYRMDFWINFIGSNVVQFIIAFFIWKSIFTQQHLTQIKGMSFSMLIFYYVLAPLSYRATSGLMMRFMFDDIYNGGLNKYLLYPLSYIKFKLITQYAKSSFFLIQFFIVAGGYLFIFGAPTEANLSLPNTLLFILTTLLGSYLYFMLASIFEMISFWADNIWSIMVMLRFLTSLFSGLMIPLSLFPDWSQGILNILPFRYLLSYPLNIFLGKLNIIEIITGLIIMFLWSILLTYIVQIIWQRGSKQYTGIGI